MAYGTEALSYQWRFNGANIAGANSPILRLTGVTNANAGNYSRRRHQQRRQCGQQCRDAAASPRARRPPSRPASSLSRGRSRCNVGNTATFAVGVDGTGPLSFQWRRDGVNIAGATSAVLTFHSVALPNAGIYSVVVSNSAGAVRAAMRCSTSAAAVGDRADHHLTTFDGHRPAGGSAMLAVGATGSGPLSYQWRERHGDSGATLPVLSLTNVGDANVGTYTVDDHQQRARR